MFDVRAYFRQFLTTAPALNAAQLRVAVVYLLRSNLTSQAWLSNARLEQETGLTRRDVQEARKELVGMGFLVPTGYVKTVPRYRVVMTEAIRPLSKGVHDPAPKSIRPIRASGPESDQTQNKLLHEAVACDAITITAAATAAAEDAGSSGSCLDGAAALPAIEEEAQQQPTNALVAAMLSRGVALDVANQIIAFQESRQWRDRDGKPIANRVAACTALASRWRSHNAKAVPAHGGDEGRGSGGQLAPKNLPRFPFDASNAPEGSRLAWSQCVESIAAELASEGRMFKQGVTFDDVAWGFLNTEVVEDQRDAGTVNFDACRWAVKKLARCYGVDFDAGGWAEAVSGAMDFDRACRESRLADSKPPQTEQPTEAQPVAPVEEPQEPPATPYDVAAMVAQFQAQRAEPQGGENGHSTT
ncbi:MAG: hypothetical protein NTV22_09770 [bacterium]|nr:hypothetical protein [bacterium]